MDILAFKRKLAELQFQVNEIEDKCKDISRPQERQQWYKERITGIVMKALQLFELCDESPAIRASFQEFMDYMRARQAVFNQLEQKDNDLQRFENELSKLSSLADIVEDKCNRLDSVEERRQHFEERIRELSIKA